jgi:methyl-accepting chemotaxis protein
MPIETLASRLRLSSLSLNARICLTATALVILSLAVTATVIGVRGSRSAEAASMQLARTAAREAAEAVRARIGANLSAVVNLAAAMRATRGTGMTLARPQIGEMTKATLLGSEDLIGTAVTWEPGALDGKDAEYAGKQPEYDASGRYMPYYTRSGGSVHVEPIVFSDAPGANDWYDVPKRSRRLFFTEPYAYPVGEAGADGVAGGADPGRRPVQGHGQRRFHADPPGRYPRRHEVHRRRQPVAGVERWFVRQPS